MSKKRLSTKWIAAISIDFVLILVTILRHVIGYGTTPRIDTSTSRDPGELVVNIVNEYNKGYLEEIAIVGFLLLILNFILIRKLEKPFLKSTILVIAYVLITVASLLIISNRFKYLNLQ